MAAKPPKPPGNFLKNLILTKNSNNNNNEIESLKKETEKASASTVATLKSNSTCVNADNNYKNPTNNTTTSNTTSPSTTKKVNCNCTNITIMHLFHEMKQEFPTIPDTIVTQCVNENCHQREKCIQMLRNELELNPIPVQSYPAKVLHPINHHHHNNNNNNSNNNNNNNNSHHHHNNLAGTTTLPGSPSAVNSSLKPPLQQKPLVQQRPSLKPPLKPVRPAPLQPPSTATNNLKSPNLQRKIATIPNQSASKTSIKTLSVEGASPGGEGHLNEKLNDMPAKTTGIQQTPTLQHSVNSPHNDAGELNNNENCLNVAGGGGGETNLPRARPTTLNLNIQQQQRQRLNVQLQEHFQQQRNQQQQQQLQQQSLSLQQQQQINNSGSLTNKPLRKAPLPPIAPKPILFHHNNNNNSINHNVGGGGGGSDSAVVSPQSESEISVNLTLSTPSPTSSTSSSSLTAAAASKTHHTTTQHLQNKSPIRHRSVITLQPEPPYTRDFLSQSTSPAIQTPTTCTAGSSVVSSPTNSAHSGSSQKSYTSVNLTLRPPTTVLNSALQPSAIDITAGPGFSGASGGGKSLSYSSTSYDARLGYQQNFHITVTDEGGVFSASRRRPQQQQRNINQVNICKNEFDGNTDGDKGNNVNSLCAEQQQQQQQFHNSDVVALRQQPQLHQQLQYNPHQQQQQQNNQINSPQGIGCSSGFGSMCLAPQQAEEDAFVTETLERQKKRRDRLAGALRENKKRLSQVEQEVNLITGAIPVGLSERLDIEIQKLRAECQAMLRSSNPLTQQQRPSHTPQQQQQQFPPQPFPRQRSSRQPPSGATVRQSSLDIIQHHTTPTITTPHTPASLPNFINTPSPTMMVSPQQQLQHSHPSLSPPSIYHQQQQQHQQQGMSYNQTSPQYLNPANNFIPEDEPPYYYSDQDAGDYDDDDDDDDECEEDKRWECSMCTFRNHPQLNICECCDNIRIKPGTLTNLSRALSANSATSLATVGGGGGGGSGGLSSSVTNGSVMDVNTAVAAAANAAAASTNGNMNSAASNGNLEHDTNLAQQQLQHLALHI